MKFLMQLFKLHFVLHNELHTMQSSPFLHLTLNAKEKEKPELFLNNILWSDKKKKNLLALIHAMFEE